MLISFSHYIYQRVEESDLIVRRSDRHTWSHQGKLISGLITSSLVASLEFSIRGGEFLIRKVVCFTCPSPREAALFDAMEASSEILDKSLYEITSVCSRGIMSNTVISRFPVHDFMTV